MEVKTIVYTNSKKQAAVAIAAAMESLLEHGSNTGKVIPMTENNGLQFKVFTIHVFTNNFNDSYQSVGVNRGTASIVPNLLIMPATKAADCSVSSQLCWRLHHNRLAPLMYSLVQEMGHVNRNLLEGPGDNPYEVHMSFLCLVKLYVRILQGTDPHEQAIDRNCDVLPIYYDPLIVMFVSIQYLMLNKIVRACLF
jgi:hypothetical protein